MQENLGKYGYICKVQLKIRTKKLEPGPRNAHTEGRVRAVLVPPPGDDGAACRSTRFTPYIESKK